MPAVQAKTNQIDWAGIRANAVSMGIRAAARVAAHNLPDIERDRFVFRVLKRASREKWEDKKAAAVSSITVRNEKPLSSNVLDGADSVAKMLAEDGLHTRLGFSKAARKVAESLPNRSGDDLLERDTAQAAKHWAGVASIAQPGWEQERKAEGGLVSVALIRLELSSNVRTEQAPNDPADRARPVHAIETGE